jgi:hypothetical protein
LGGDGEQGCNAADWVRGTGMQIPPTYPLQWASANIAGVSWIGEGEKEMDWDVLCWTAVQWNGSGRVGMQPSTTLLLCLITDSSHKGCWTR